MQGERGERGYDCTVRKGSTPEKGESKVKHRRGTEITERERETVGGRENVRSDNFEITNGKVTGEWARKKRRPKRKSGEIN